jgi:hypothetical protein
MKRLAVLMLGLGLAISSVAVTFAQDTADTTTKKKKKKKSGDEQKKEMTQQQQQK